MSLIITALIFFLLYLLLQPAFRVWRTYRNMKKGNFDFMSDIFGQPGGQKSTSAYNRNGSRREGWSKPRIRKKKIGNDAGEYIQFSEIRITASQADNTSREKPDTYAYAEPQIVDIEWEEIPQTRN